MKKYLYTLLFMAVALFSVATMVSCGSDDNEIVNTTKNKYTFAFKIETKNAKVAENEQFKKFVSEKEAALVESLKSEYYLNDSEAMSEWNRIERDGEYRSLIQNILDSIAKMYDDTTLTCTLKMLKNGNDWNSKKWETLYHGY